MRIRLFLLVTATALTAVTASSSPRTFEERLGSPLRVIGEVWPHGHVVKAETGRVTRPAPDYWFGAEVFKGGWIALHFVGGACSGVDHVGIHYSVEAVTLTLFQGRLIRTGNVYCEARGISSKIFVHLREPLGNRRLYDGSENAAYISSAHVLSDEVGRRENLTTDEVEACPADRGCTRWVRLIHGAPGSVCDNYSEHESGCQGPTQFMRR